ncbi:snare-like protein [Ophiobolus disseminans]|uniref:Synaptobrevin homolog YKT6 n=1 Tax=Ophiobolus disseminans TaxID=1469910 RepID=A0A6A7A6H9_9PLEO|nr:snare-like protein [Ophiobolus disseminans]
MKLLYLAVLKNDVTPVSPELCVERDLSSYNYFQRATVAKFLTFFATEVVGPRTGPDVTKSITMEDKDKELDVMLHIHSRKEGICVISITDKVYPDRVALALCRKVAEEFTYKFPRTAYESAKVGSPQLSYPELATYLEKYQNPEEADNIAKIQKELDQTTQVMREAMESLLERGEKIDNLVSKSDNLSQQSKMFYTQAKKQNSCCTVM